MPRVERIETPRLVATRLRESDLGLLRQMDTDARIMNTLGGIRSDRETAEYLETNLRHWEEHGFGLWILNSRVDGEFVGRAALRHVHIAGNNEIEVGYALMPEFWGFGLATEIAERIVEVAFAQLRLPNLVAFTLLNNRASRRVIEKIGGRFEQETTYRGYPHLLFRIRP